MPKRKRKADYNGEPNYRKKKQNCSVPPSSEDDIKIQIANKIETLQVEVHILRAQVNILRRQMNDLRREPQESEEQEVNQCGVM